ncbi:MAG: response regulator transcription factor [Prolixibacteraceae bacterium]|jgi:DNA-binding NarL/FixJ family response regulator
MRIVIADDSALIRERLQNMLLEYGLVDIVGSFNNGSDTLIALQTLKPDLAIVDIEMPGQSGLEILKEIRKKDSALKFIILTFHATDYYRKLAINTGADYFFSKVDDFDKVELVINNLLNNNLQ